MTIKQIIANFWHALEQECHEIPVSITLPPKTFDRLVLECGGPRGPGQTTHLYLTHYNEVMGVVRGVGTTEAAQLHSNASKEGGTP